MTPRSWWAVGLLALALALSHVLALRPSSVIRSRSALPAPPCPPRIHSQLASAPTPDPNNEADPPPPSRSSSTGDQQQPWSSTVEEILAQLETQQPELWNSTLELLAALPLDVMGDFDSTNRKRLKTSLESSVATLTQRLETLELSMQALSPDRPSSLSLPSPSASGSSALLDGEGSLRATFDKNATGARVLLRGPSRFSRRSLPPPQSPAGGIGPLQKRRGSRSSAVDDCGVYLYLFDHSKHAAGTAIAGFLLGLFLERLLMPTGSWLLSGLVGGYACLFLVGMQTGFGKWIQTVFGRRFDVPVQALRLRVDEFLFLWKTGETSYQWTKRMQPVLRDWQLDERLRMLGAAGREVLKQANRVERKYRLGDRAVSTVQQLCTGAVDLWQRKAPRGLQRLSRQCRTFVDARRQQLSRAMETDKQRRDRLLKEYRVGFLGRRTWRRFDD